jgi:hypothetical protein
MDKRVRFINRQTKDIINWRPRTDVHIKISSRGDDLRVELVEETGQAVATVQPPLPARPGSFRHRRR